MNVAERFGFNVGASFAPHPQVQGVIGCGVEIELENVGEARLDTQYWRTTTDGSLRNNGREFVFNGPQGGEALFNACVELDSFLVRQNPEGNWRCSTHVHVDMRDKEVEQLKKIIVGAIVYEKLLFRLSGFSRYKNNFCASFGVAQDQIRILAEAWNRNDRSFLTLVTNQWDKYSALNLKPLAQYGSIEFRLSEATWRKGKLVRLCNRYLGLVEYCSAFPGSCEELIADLAEKQPKQVMRKGIGNQPLPEDWEEDLATGLKLAYDMLLLAAVPETERRVIIRANGNPVPVLQEYMSQIIGSLEQRGFDVEGTVRNHSHQGIVYAIPSYEVIQQYLESVSLSAIEVLDEYGMGFYRQYNNAPTWFDEVESDEEDLEEDW